MFPELFEVSHMVYWKWILFSSLSRACGMRNLLQERSLGVHIICEIGLHLLWFQVEAGLKGRWTQLSCSCPSVEHDLLFQIIHDYEKFPPFFPLVVSKLSAASSTLNLFKYRNIPPFTIVIYVAITLISTTVVKRQSCLMDGHKGFDHDGVLAFPCSTLLHTLTVVETYQKRSSEIRG